MPKQCPLVFRNVDANLIRINTLFVTLGVIAYLMSGYIAITIFLAVDFILRLYGYKHISPIQLSSLQIQKFLHIPVKMEDAGAKRLAAFFGLGFMVALTLAGLIEDTVLEWLIGGVYLICALPYLTVGYCVGCQIYYLIKKLFPSY